MKELEENITPANIGGMGPVLLPTATQVGSGDVPAGSGDAEEEYKKNKKNKKKMKKLKNFESFTSKDIVTEGRVKQFTTDLKDMIKDIKRGYGWIDPEYVEDTWENSSDSIDFELVKSEIYRQLIKAGLLAKADDDNEEEAGEYIKSLKQLGIAESESVDVIDEVNEAKFFRLPNKLNAMWDLKNSVNYIVGKHDAGQDYNPADMRTIEEFIKKIKQSAKSFKDAEEVKGTVYESLVNESFVAYTENSKGEYEVVKVLKDQRAAKAWRKKNAYLLDDDSVDVKSIGTTPKKDWDKTHPELATESVVTEGKFDGIADLVKSLHFETDPKTAEEKKIELGRKQGEVSKRKQIESGEYSLRRFRKQIGYGKGTTGVFLPGSYDAATSTLGDGPHKKAAKKVKWNQKKYEQWLEDMAANGGAFNAFDMAQNAKNETGLIDWVKKNFRGEDPMQRIQWDIEAFA